MVDFTNLRTGISNCRFKPWFDFWFLVPKICGYSHEAGGGGLNEFGGPIIQIQIFWIELRIFRIQIWIFRIQIRIFRIQIRIFRIQIRIFRIQIRIFPDFLGVKKTQNLWVLASVLAPP